MGTHIYLISELMEEELSSKFEQIPGEVFVVFRTNLDEKYRVEETPINVGTSLTEKELNEIVKGLLQDSLDSEELQSIRFEFLVKDHFLRGNLKSHILKHNITTEETLSIYYTFALNKPKLKSKNQEEDWVKAVSPVAGLKREYRPYVVGLFNGSISLYSSNNVKVKTAELCADSPVKALQVSENPVYKSLTQQMVIAGCGDETVRVAQLVLSEKDPELSTLEGFLVGEGHRCTVESVDVNPLDGHLFCSGGFDGSLLIWKLDSDALSIGNPQGAGKKSDRNPRKKVKLSLNELRPAQELRSVHTECLSQLIWRDQKTIITGSHDHTVKFFDADKLAESQTIKCGDNIVSALAATNQMLLTGHEDAYIRLWDERAGMRQVSRLFKSHSLWVSSLEFHPVNEFVFISGSYDKGVKVWDIRSDFPLMTVKTHLDKVFSARWNGTDHLVSGGSDSLVAIHSLTN
eukprot:TRINITY_DN4910_c0_g1_i2.p1 TRINITY_DN4910_c0_g1~~TRINITY_DN4910_c0_g1_i2.p1  ORF type:complete len:493 (+),score=123.99 TRINITY_DN4910_c0_g1_i2:99-1481(+)